MSQYADYVKERFNAVTIECEEGFCTVNIVEVPDKNVGTKTKEALLTDIYIEPKFRGKGNAVKVLGMIETFAREQKCKSLKTTIDIREAGFDRRFNALCKHGFKSASMSQPSILMMKEL